MKKTLFTFIVFCFVGISWVNAQKVQKYQIPYYVDGTYDTLVVVTDSLEAVLIKYSLIYAGIKVQDDTIGRRIHFPYKLKVSPKVYRNYGFALGIQVKTVGDICKGIIQLRAQSAYGQKIQIAKSIGGGFKESITDAKRKTLVYGRDPNRRANEKVWHLDEINAEYRKMSKEIIKYLSQEKIILKSEKKELRIRKKLERKKRRKARREERKK